MSSGGQTTTYRRPSVSIGMGLDGADYSYLTKQTAEQSGFFITFNVPFKKEDVYTELLNDEFPLGFERDMGAEFTVLKPGREAGKLVSTGCVREAVFPTPVWGKTISELRESKAPSYIRWAIMVQSGSFFYLVPPPDNNPKVQIALKELKKNQGTQVTIRMDCAYVEFRGLLCCLSFLAQDLLKSSMETQLPSKWTESMMRRGYERAEKKKKKGGGGKGLL